MEKLIPFEKLSKKEQRKRNAARRAGWCGLNPVTRKPENPKAYNRRKARKWSNDSMTVPFAMPAKSAAFYLSVIFPAQYSFARRQQDLLCPYFITGRGCTVLLRAQAARAIC